MEKYFLLIVSMFIVLSPVFCNATPVIQSYGVFDVTFYNTGDTDGYATGQGDWTSQQMVDVAASIAVWQNNIGNTPGRQIEMHVFWNELDPYGTNVLGGSASYRIYDGTTIWNAGENAWKESDGYDYGLPFDTVIQYDTTAAGYGWNFGPDNPLYNEIDFRSVITHEIGHSLGWDSSYSPSPYDNWGLLGGGSYGGITDWDKTSLTARATGRKTAAQAHLAISMSSIIRFSLTEQTLWHYMAALFQFMPRILMNPAQV